MKDKIKAVALFSGGLDSILAVKLIQEQGIEVKGVNFKTPFFGEILSMD
jgi:tRNA-specific 2-thiouridylase